MERNDPRYQAYVEILKEELIPAMGCTEPIALAYAAAKAREVLGVLPDSVQLQVSGSIIKNVKSGHRAQHRAPEGHGGGGGGRHHRRFR